MLSRSSQLLCKRYSSSCKPRRLSQRISSSSSSIFSFPSSYRSVSTTSTISSHKSTRSPVSPFLGPLATPLATFAPRCVSTCSLFFTSYNAFHTITNIVPQSQAMNKPSFLLSDEAKAVGFHVRETPDTPATQFLQSSGINASTELSPDTFTFISPSVSEDFSELVDTSKPKTNALQQVLGISEHTVIKTLLFQDPRTGSPLCILQHGDRLVNTKPAARAAGFKSIVSLSPEQANELSGYVVGGTSPFGLKTPMPIILQQSILELDEIIINGGGLHNLIVMSPQLIVKAFESHENFPVHVVDCAKLRKPVEPDAQ